ncbi:MAG: phosphotransferase [Micromonosporaceae bacterium]
MEPVPRLAVDPTLSRLFEVTGVRLVADGAPATGEVGAAYVRWPDGHRSVLTRSPTDPSALIEVARRAGIPAPEYEMVVDLGGAYAVVQELLPGAPPQTVDRGLVEQMLGVNRRLAGLVAARTDLPPVTLHLRTSGPGFCLHQTLAEYSPRTVRLLRRIHRIGAVRDTADGSDLVHLDYHPQNLLVCDGQVTGLVDWDGAGRGDGALDLVTLRYDLALRAPDLGPWMDALLTASVAPERLLAYRAHMALRLVDWAIRHHGPDRVELWLDLAEQQWDG